MLAALLRARQDVATSREPEPGGKFAPFPGPRFHLIDKCAPFPEQQACRGHTSGGLAFDVGGVCRSFVTPRFGLR